MDLATAPSFVMVRSSLRLALAGRDCSGFPLSALSWLRERRVDGSPHAVAAKNRLNAATDTRAD
jgi:hypothetical protein